MVVGANEEDQREREGRRKGKKKGERDGSHGKFVIFIVFSDGNDLMIGIPRLVVIRVVRCLVNRKSS